MATTVEWVPTTSKKAGYLQDRALVGGYEGKDRHALWVIRAWFKGDLIPGMLAVKNSRAYVAYEREAHEVLNIEVCCVPSNKIKWIKARDGKVPPRAIPGGSTFTGETLYVGRAREQNDLIPGKVHPTHETMYITFDDKEIECKFYEVLCMAE